MRVSQYIKPDKLKTYFKDLGIKQKEVAYRIGVRESTVSEWVNGKHRITPRHRKKLMKLIRHYKKLSKLNFYD